MDVNQALPKEYSIYRRAIERRWVRAARAVGKVVLWTDPLPSDETAQAFARSYFDGDPPADAFVRDLPSIGGFGRGRDLVEQALREGPDAVPDAPPSLKALLEHITAEPEWLDRVKVERGARVYRRLGIPALSIDVGGQMLGYTEQADVQPVLLSGTYGRDLHGRLIDTARYHLEASEPGALEMNWPASEGLAITVRVRVLHAYIRSRVAASEKWRGDEWGVPISQYQMIGPMLGQSVGTAMAAMMVAGLLSTRGEQDALLHFWRYNGYLMGMDPEWFPRSVNDSIRATTFYFLRRRLDAMEECAGIVERVPAAFAPRPGAPFRDRVRDRLNQQRQIGWLATSFGPLYLKFRLPVPFLGWALNAAPFGVNVVLTLLAWSGERGRAYVDQVQRRRRRRWYDTEVSRQTGTAAAYAPHVSVTAAG